MRRGGQVSVCMLEREAEEEEEMLLEYRSQERGRILIRAEQTEASSSIKPTEEGGGSTVSVERKERKGAAPGPGPVRRIITVLDSSERGLDCHRHPEFNKTDLRETQREGGGEKMQSPASV